MIPSIADTFLACVFINKTFSCTMRPSESFGGIHFAASWENIQGLGCGLSVQGLRSDVEVRDLLVQVLDIIRSQARVDEGAKEQPRVVISSSSDLPPGDYFPPEEGTGEAPKMPSTFTRAIADDEA